MKLTPKQLATLWRFAKVVACEAAADALTVGWAFLQGHGASLGISDVALVLIMQTGTPVIAAAEKWLHWEETQP